jgi:hypothetical protein
MNKSSTWILLALAAGFVLFGGAAVLNSGFPQYVTDLANAVATAEGFYVSGSKPQRQNNPGDITSGGVIQTFSTIQDGWTALYNQIAMMFNNTSGIYNSSMSLSQIGLTYALDPNWGNNVASVLGVSPSTTLDQFRQSYGG